MSHKQAVAHLQKLRDTARSAGVAESVRGVQEAAACDQQRGGQQADRPTAHGGAAQQRSAATAHGQGMPPDLPLPLLWCSLGSWANGGSYHLMVWRDFAWVHVAVCWRAIGSLTGALFGPSTGDCFFKPFRRYCGPPHLSTGGRLPICLRHAQPPVSDQRPRPPLCGGVVRQGEEVWQSRGGLAGVPGGAFLCALCGFGTQPSAGKLERKLPSGSMCSGSMCHMRATCEEIRR